VGTRQLEHIIGQVVIASFGHRVDPQLLIRMLQRHFGATVATCPASR